MYGNVTQIAETNELNLILGLVSPQATYKGMNEDKIKQQEVNPDAENNPVSEQSNTRYRLKAAAFLTFIGGLGFASGFGGAVAAAKKQDPASFDHGLTQSKAEKV